MDNFEELPLAQEVAMDAMKREDWNGDEDVNPSPTDQVATSSPVPDALGVTENKDDIDGATAVEIEGDNKKIQKEEGNSSKISETGQEKESNRMSSTSVQLEGTKAPKTSHNNCSMTEGHVCFDCFPIPDELLVKLHRQTGLSKLMCLQTVQTVIKFYKHDLACTNYFAHDLTLTNRNPNAGDSYGEYSIDSDSLSESVFSFKHPPLIPPWKKEKEPVATSSNVLDLGEPLPLVNQVASGKEKIRTYPAPATKPIAKVVINGVEQFRNLIHRLKSAPAEFWTDSQNASSVFIFFRKLNKLAVKLDRSILKRLLLEDDMEFVWILTRFLRHERRWSIQWEIVGVLGTVAARDSRARKKMLESDFSIYLSRAILDYNSEPARLAAYAELLTVLFTGGRPVPISHMDHFGVDFVEAILNMIEEDDSRPGWALPEAFVKLLLAYNLQFNVDDVYDNLTIVGITRVDNCKTLTTRLVDWMEAKDCPLTSSWDVAVSVHQCVIKLTTDIFSCRTTSHTFSGSQSIILTRRLLKSLPNFLPGDKRRTSHIKLIQAILRHCKYHNVRNTPYMDNLEDILMETSSLSYHDQDLVRSIFKQFPQLKKESESDIDIDGY